MGTELHIIEKQHELEKYTVVDEKTHVFFMLNYSGTLHVEIQSEFAKVYIFGIYIGKGEDNIKIVTKQDHQRGNALSDLLIRGVFFDSSKFLYEGLITIAKKAQGSNAYQKNQNLILSKNAYVDSRPFLEIQANDVRCTHGSTTGRIDKEQRQYLSARGIDNKNAEKLIVTGFIDEVFTRMNEVAEDIDVSRLRKKVVEYA